MAKNIVVIGSSGAIGQEFVKQLSFDNIVYSFSRTTPNINKNNVFYHSIDYQDEESIKQAARIASENGSIDMVIVATGVLHTADVWPEKSINELSFNNFAQIFQANTFLPALISKHFLPKLSKATPTVFAALSARVGSISDNRLGGWYAYRASKAALNMIIKNLAIEMARSNKQAKIIGLHPGTVDSDLSRPFQANVAKEKLFTPEFATTKLLEVLNNHSNLESGFLYAWDGKKIEF
jgi:NAD(P)-dependent dehydrogenase (short-subunit alcohol dehydrogenase family)